MATFDGEFGLQLVIRMLENNGRYGDDPPAYVIHYYWNRLFKVHNFHVSYSLAEYASLCDSPAPGLVAVIWNSWGPIKISPLGQAILRGEKPWEGKTQEEFTTWLLKQSWGTLIPPAQDDPKSQDDPK